MQTNDTQIFNLFERSAQLLWSPGQEPVMVLRLKKEAKMPRGGGSRITITVNGNSIANLLRSSQEGSFTTDVREVRVPVGPVLDLRVIDEFGQCCFETQFIIWNPAALFVPIHPETHEIAPLQFLPRDWNCCDFLLASDVDILPKPEVREPVGSSGYDVVQVRLPEQIKVIGFSVDGRREADLRRAQKSVTGQNISTNWLHADNFSTGHVRGESLPTIGLALKTAKPLSIISAKAMLGDWQTEWDTTKPSHDFQPPLRCWTDEMHVSVKVANDEEIHEVLIERNLPWKGAILFSDEGEAHAISEEDALEVRALRAGRLAVSFVKPNQISGRAPQTPDGFFLREEHREIQGTEPRTIKSKDHGKTEDRWMLMPTTLPGIHGLGGLLRYPALIVAGEIVDHGLIASVSARGQDLNVTLHCPVEFEPLHSLVIFGVSDAGRLKVSTQSLTWYVRALNNAELTVAVPEFAKILAVGLSYDGWRLGAWWSQDLGPAIIRAGMQDDEGRRAAALLRWMRAPLLSRASWHGKAARIWFRQFIVASPTTTLGAWLRDETLRLDGATLCMPPDDDAWLDAVREILLDETYLFSPDEAARLVELLGKNTTYSGEDPVSMACQACTQMLRICPVAAVRLCDAILHQFCKADRLELVQALMSRCGYPSHNRNCIKLLTGVDPFAVQGSLPDVREILSRQASPSKKFRSRFRHLAHYQPFRSYALWEWLQELKLHLSSQ